MCLVSILKTTNSSFQKCMTFCHIIYVKKVMKLLAIIFEQPSYYYKALTNLRPAYISSLLKPASESYTGSFRSLKMDFSPYLNHVLPYATAPLFLIFFLRNFRDTLPQPIRSKPIFNSFKTSLKNALFSSDTLFIP